MAVFIKIRNRFGIIIAVVIGLMLAVFVLESALNSQSSLLKGHSNTVAKFNGHSVSFDDFNVKYKESMELFEMGQKGKKTDANVENQLRNKVFSQFLSERLADRLYGDIGLEVGNEEEADLLYSPEYASPNVRQVPIFQNQQTHSFDPSYVRAYINKLDQDDTKQGGNTPRQKQLQWAEFEESVFNEALSSKYKNLAKAALYIPKWLAEMDYTEKNTKQEVRFLMIPYSSVSDSDKAVKVTDEDVQHYIDLHKEMFRQQEPVRKIDFVTFTIKPSAEDTESARKFVYDAFDRLSANPDDSDYLKKNTFHGGLDRRYLGGYDMESNLLKDTLKNIKANSLVGPYFEDGFYKLAKIGEKKNMPDSVQFSLILFKADFKSKDSTKALHKADSVLTALKDGKANFNDASKTYNDDQQLKEKNGLLGFVKPSSTAPEIDKFLFGEGKKDEVKRVRVPEGYIIVKIDSIAPVSMHAQMNMVKREVRSSTKTDNYYFDLATKFQAAGTSAAQFDKTAKEQNQHKQQADVHHNDFSVTGFGNSDCRNLVKWVYESGKGAVSDPISIDNDKYVVALISEISDGDYESVGVARPQCEPLIKMEKKAKIIMQKIVAASSMNATIESIASLTGQQVKSSSDVNFASGYIKDLGNEPKACAVASCINVNTTSAPIQGNAGVIVLQVVSRQVAPPVADYAQQRQQLAQQSGQMYDYLLSIQQQQQNPTILTTLTQIIRFHVEDNRYKFY